MKKYIVGFIFGALIFGSVGVLASNIYARDITYNNTNVESALNDLYEKALLDNANTLRLVNNTNNISAEVGKKYLIVISVTSYNTESQKYKPSIVSGCTIEKTAGEVGHTFDVLATYSNAYIVKATSNTITIQGNVVDSNWSFVTYYKID